LRAACEDDFLRGVCVCSFLEHKATRQFPRCDANRRQSKRCMRANCIAFHRRECTFNFCSRRGSNECTHTQKERRPAAKIHFISVSRSAGVCVWESRESLAAESHTLSWRTVNKYIYRMACTQFACQKFHFTCKKWKIKRARAHCTYKV
jgi:hypothetical protein